MSDALRPGLPALPDSMKSLPVRRGYPVPFFVARVNGDFDFRVADQRKIKLCVEAQLCWLCGKPMGRELVFAIGPMCALNRISSEPPSHPECATFGVTACPFLSRPHMVRREAGMPEGVVDQSGHMITRNPGVTLLWYTTGFRIFRPRTGGALFDVGYPDKVEAYAEGRAATEVEIVEAIVSGLPTLMSADADNPAAFRELAGRARAAERLLRLPAGAIAEPAAALAPAA